MPNFTKHFNLKKPLQEEFYDIDDHNGNMDIIDETLQLLSEDSGVVISPDEPEKGDVWIDTDDDEGSQGGVTSVNGQTGAVNLTASDVDAYSVGQTYSKTEVDGLFDENKYTHPSSHPASMITETNDQKIMTAAERTKLANIADYANNYTHPSSHPATMITGLAEQLASLGYTKIAVGSFVGDGTGTNTMKIQPGAIPGWDPDVEYYDTRTITLPFAPNGIIIFTAGYPNVITVNQGQKIETKSPHATNLEPGKYYPCELSGANLNVGAKDTYDNVVYPAQVAITTTYASYSMNTSGITYYYLAF